MKRQPTRLSALVLKAASFSAEETCIGHQQKRIQHCPHAWGCIGAAAGINKLSCVTSVAAVHWCAEVGWLHQDANTRLATLLHTLYMAVALGVQHKVWQFQHRVAQRTLTLKLIE